MDLVISILSDIYVVVPLIILAATLVWFYMPVRTTRPVPLVKAKPKSGTKKQEDDEEGSSAGLTPLTIFYGSQTGTAEDFSRKLAMESKRYKFKAKVVDLEEYDPDDLADEQVVMFLMATYGEGEPTDNARDFYEWLMDESRMQDLLADVKFTVFALGNKTYENYNTMGRNVDKRLAQLGATRVFKRGEGDDDSSLEDDFAAWKKVMWPGLCKELGIEVEADKGAVTEERRFKLDIHPAGTPKYELAKKNVMNHLSKRPGLLSSMDGTADIKNPYRARIVVNRELHSVGSDRSCRHIEIDIGDKLHYEVGDHLGVYPENDPRVVEDFARRANIELDAVFSLINVDALPNAKPFLGPCTFRQALMQWYDLTGIPRKGLIHVLAQYATDPEQKKQLLLLSHDEKPQPYARYIKDDMRSVGQLLHEFPSINIPVDHLLEILPRLAPRYYSISSSLKEHPGRVHVTSVVVNFQTPANRKHDGVSSNWLARQIPTEKHHPGVYIFVQKANFRLPPPHVPVVMVGPGTGLAPFRGFIQERKLTHRKGVSSKNLLFFGCRSPDIDYLYREELEEAEKEGFLKLVLAFSRHENKKVYVQHKMEEQEDEIWDIVHHQKGYVYICGDARVMAKDVHANLVKIISTKEGITKEKAEEYIAQMQKSGRYLTDVWY